MYMKYKSIILGIVFACLALPAGAQEADSTDVSGNGTNPHTTVGRKRVLPIVTTKIRLLTRSYGDSIVLRWLAEDFVSYKYLATTGVNVLRVKHDVSEDTLPSRGLHIDTLNCHDAAGPKDEHPPNI